MAHPEDLVTTREACKLLQITRPTLYSWIERGKIKPWGRLGGQEAWFFLKGEVMKVKAMDIKYERVRVRSLNSKILTLLEKALTKAISNK